MGKNSDWRSRGTLGNHWQKPYVLRNPSWKTLLYLFTYLPVM